MFRIPKHNRPRRAPALLWALVGLILSPIVMARGLSLPEIEQLALASDPGVRSIRANQQALGELSVAAEQLPDPLLKMGLVSLPTDTFNLGQEPMTQVQVGVVQKFPRGQSRSLRSSQIDLQSSGLAEQARDQELSILLSVRELYLEVLKQQKLSDINAEALLAFSDVVDITQDYYATGRVQQQDVLQASVEKARIEDRATRIAQDEEQARIRLAVWIGESAYRDLDRQWPELNAPPEPALFEQNLLNHPRIQALQFDMLAAENGIELAEQKYRPEFALDLTYGGRGGTNPDGTSRPDLFTVMLMMDLPLFHKNRQDREVAARVAESSAAMFSRDNLHRRMSREVDYHRLTLQKQRERIEQYEHSLLPKAAFSSAASFEAYQSGIENLTTILRTRITELDLQLEHARLQVEALKSEARLLYLAGE